MDAPPQEAATAGRPRRLLGSLVWAREAAVLLGLALVAFVAGSRIGTPGFLVEHRHLEVEEVVVGLLLAGAAAALYVLRQHRSARSDARQMERAEEALADTTVRYQSLFDQHPHGVYSLDREGRFTDANPACTALSGYAAEELRGTSFADIVPAEAYEEMAAVFARILGGRPTVFLAHVRHKAGHLIELNVTGIPIREGAEVVGVYGIAEDVTKQRRMQRAMERSLREAREANAAKALFLANVGHEIRTPLTTILGYTELLADEDLAPHQAGFVETMHRSGQRVVRIVEDILDFSTLRAGTLHLEESTIALGGVIDDVVASARGSAARKSLAFEVTIGPDVPEQVTGDGDRIYQVLDNLIENAVKFTDAGGVSLRVSTEEVDGARSLVFEVSDTGIGISEEDLPLVFDAFHQADPTATRRHGGTGLGLAIVDQLVTRMGGRLSVTSQPGRGSTFSCRLPLAETEPGDTTSSRPDLPPPSRARHQA